MIPCTNRALERMVRILDRERSQQEPITTMKVKIDKNPAGRLRVEFMLPGAKKPTVIEGEQLTALIAMLNLAKNAEHFNFEIEVKQ